MLTIQLLSKVWILLSRCTAFTFAHTAELPGIERFHHTTRSAHWTGMFGKLSQDKDDMHQSLLTVCAQKSSCCVITCRCKPIFIMDSTGRLACVVFAVFFLKTERSTTSLPVAVAGLVLSQDGTFSVCFIDSAGKSVFFFSSQSLPTSMQLMAKGNAASRYVGCAPKLFGPCLTAC